MTDNTKISDRCKGYCLKITEDTVLDDTGVCRGCNMKLSEYLFYSLDILRNDFTELDERIIELEKLK